MLSRMTCFPHSPYQSILTPTYLYLNSSDLHSTVYVRLGGGCWCCYHCPLTHLHLLCYSCPASPLQRGRLSQNHVQHRYREPVHMGSSCFHLPCYCSNWYALHMIPNFRLCWTLFFLKGKGRPCNYRCIGSDFPEYVPSRVCASMCMTWHIIPWSDSVDRYTYHPQPRVSRGSPNVPLTLSSPIYLWPAAVYLLRCCELVLSTSPANRPRSAPMSIWLPYPLLLCCGPVYPPWRRCGPLPYLHLLL